MTEAVLLVGGRGTRLRPLTIDVPKPMLPTAGVPFLSHPLTRARDAGIEHVVLATSYRPEVFEEHFGDGRALGLAIDYVQERVPLGTGGAIRNAAAQLSSGPDDPVVILNGDILSGHDIAGQVTAHLAAAAEVTLHLIEVEDAHRFGCVPTDAHGRVTDFLEKSPEPVTNLINAGCYVFRRGVIDDLPSGRVVSVEREIFPDLVRRGAFVLGHADAAYWLDVGLPADYVRGSSDVVLGRLTSDALTGAREFLVLPEASVAPDAILGAGTTVGSGCVVAPGARVEGSVLLDGARIEEGAVVRATAVGRDAVVGRNAVLDRVVVGHRAEIGPDNELLSGLRVWSDVRIPAGAVRFSSDE
jgi:mannose-1-phosphate guanylyltransferase